MIAKNYLTPIILFAITLAIYVFSHKGEGAHFNYFVHLADAFLNGRLNLLEHPGWLNELVNFQGKYYVVYPPMPAILLMPLVAIFGSNFYQPALSIILSAVNVGLCFLVLKKLFPDKISIAVSILYAFGTMQWYHGEVGSAWYIAHIVALFFIWLSLLETLIKKRLFLVGLLIGFAYLARLPAIFAFVFPLIYLHQKFIVFDQRLKINLRSFVLLGSGLLIGVLFNGWYNYARFGVVYDISYSLLPVFNEPWYRFGLISINYIPEHLKEIFTALPIIRSGPPFLIPSMFVMALWFVTPAFLLIPFAKYREKLVLAVAVTVLIMAIPSLIHGGNGLTQFGYRYALDYHPFLLILVASALRDKLRWWAVILITISILINAWGVILISHLNLWGF